MTKRLLLPLSGIYGLITSARNFLFDNHLLETVRPAIVSVSVGNLAVGGTGKTPMVEFLIKWYHTHQAVLPCELATLSRGYGRRTTGFIEASDADTAATIGDEPCQLYRKFTSFVRVFVGERRADALRQIQQQYPDTKLVLLDDAFQHRAVRPHLNLLLTDYNRPFYTDYPFPAGRLRERRTGARRADAVVVTKCPGDLSATQQEQISEQILRYARPTTPVFFAGLRYGQPMPFATNRSDGPLREVVLVSGLANADPLEDYVRQTYALQQHHRFRDHHAYTRADLNRLLAGLPAGGSLLTTEKDWVKLTDLLTPDEQTRCPLFYLPVALQLVPGSDTAFSDFLANALLKNR